MIYIHRNLWKAWILNRCFIWLFIFKRKSFLYIIYTKSIRFTKYNHTKYCLLLNNKRFISLTYFIALCSSMLFSSTHMSLQKWKFLRELTNIVAIPLPLFTITFDSSLFQLLMHDNIRNRGDKSYFLMLLRGEPETNIQAYSRHACMKEQSQKRVITSLLLSSLLLLLLASYSPYSRPHWWHQWNRPTSVHAIRQTTVSNGIQKHT